MDDSDDDYIENISGDEYQGAPRRSRRNQAPKGAGGSVENMKMANGGYSWEDEYHRSWDVVQEDEGGSLAGSVAGLVEARKKRHIKDATPFQRGIIRNLILVLDFSFAMKESDLRPNRYQFVINHAIEFVTNFFDQNPISQLGILGMRNGQAISISTLGSNPNDHINALTAAKKLEPQGDPSLQNALEMARGLLFHVPSHCTKEVLVVLGALLSADPGDIHVTIDKLVIDKVRARVIGLAAQVAICKELCVKTNFGDASYYGVVLNEQHFQELMDEATTPLAESQQSQSANPASLVLMGFPSKVSEAAPSLSASDAALTQGGYVCPQCKVKVSSLPTVCPCCGLTLILSTHLARSYHHLFPLAPFIEVPCKNAHKSEFCAGCQSKFPVVARDAKNIQADGSMTSRYECPTCHSHFCIDCDVFCHEILHNCIGCQARSYSLYQVVVTKHKDAAPSLKLVMKRPDPDGEESSRPVKVRVVNDNEGPAWNEGGQAPTWGE
ncbi:Ssl1-like-domain-containing protein [Yarrowia lipolytica]|jgi:transcription initiation factor TFIIH subunit 2|uniref:General transcription and DNA repair factor IIH n=2 Tax=Yarrowia lipolytica TaxID=4952 RepID=Q6C7M6_YARLI|nr:YALI0D26862p [Yarrowia lipolytica CLIB122]AOW04701.1 hypothetical protein YALI1_D35398g [Yarrowia lipolytica]KAB8283969.1 Ssl1-like-domain-containing protein [Yarrowia lipolytica]KAE8172148.1 Ssl1-like-domain-containing protein [Yarrowia lipolytica]KAJ8053876.1 Ssl1-like-domain-containing protein [Yarrowia lipolytica]QNP98121.1 General transcription and DNA repair factor IIH subunit SSL1 [Yarrowia lipolytica]|eukprot:XP_503336.1 YALI0D26862p [Yarrowia lipolytica CLIB122]